MTIIILLGVGVVCVVIFAILTRFAPYGYEDEDGFHYGEKQK